MKRRTSLVVALLVACLLIGSLSVHAQTLRSIGLRIAISWSDTPIWLGVEASTDLGWSILSGALFITPGGKTLFTSHLDFPLEEGSPTYARATAGFYYFSASQPFPYPLGGGGIAYSAPWGSSMMIGFTGEFIYPLAFPFPMFSISGAWTPSQ